MSDSCLYFAATRSSAGTTMCLATSTRPSASDRATTSPDHNCPKEQAELALKEFFRRNTPSQFLCTTGSCYISGKLVTSAGKSYKLDYTLKTVDNKTFITNIHIY